MGSEQRVNMKSRDMRYVIFALVSCGRSYIAWLQDFVGKIRRICRRFKQSRTAYLWHHQGTGGILWLRLSISSRI